MQTVMVFLIVALAAFYALWKFMPAALRRMLVPRVVAAAQRAGLAEANARRLEAKLDSGGACGSCDSCKACETPAEPPLLDAQGAPISVIRFQKS